MRGVVVFVLVNLVSSYAWSINHQEEIAIAEEWFKSFNKPYPIVIIDRDKTNFLIKSHDALEDEDKRFKLINGYFEKEANISLTKREFISIDPYITTLIYNAFLPITSESKFCAVFVNAPNGNAQVESNRIIGFAQPNAFDKYPNFNYNNLSEKMSFRELYLFSLYHEVSHCLDDQSFEMQKNMVRDAHEIHKTEVYAEILAYFALIPRLGHKVASRRALYRTIYSRIVGEFLTTQSTFYNPHIANGGAIYNLGHYLYKAQELLYFQQIDLNNSLDHITKNFVLNHILNPREFSAIVSFLTRGTKKANEQYRNLAFDNPYLFYTAYMKLIQYEHYTDSLLDYAITVGPTPNYESLPTLNKNLLCEMIQSKNMEGYLKILDDYRSIINVGYYEPSEITTVYESLNDIASISCEDE